MTASPFLTTPTVRTADADTAVPAGRLRCNLRADIMTLYGVVSPDAWTSLVRDGVLTGREDLIDEAFIDPYTWIRAAAARRGLGDTWPVWLWAKTTRHELVGHVRRTAHLVPGSVLITARIPRSRLLLSEFGEWHCVLNHCPVFRPDATQADIDARFERLDACAPGWGQLDTAPAHAREELEQTWEWIFDTDMWPGTALWQATVAQLRLTDVTAAVTITPRRRRRAPKLVR